MHKASSSTLGWVKMRYRCSQKRVGLSHCCYRKYLSHFMFFNLQFEMQFSRNIYIYLIVRMRFLFLFFSYNTKGLTILNCFYSSGL